MGEGMVFFLVGLVGRDGMEVSGERWEWRGDYVVLFEDERGDEVWSARSGVASSMMMLRLKRTHVEMTV